MYPPYKLAADGAGLWSCLLRGPASLDGLVLGICATALALLIQKG